MCNDHSTICRNAVRRDSTAPVWYTILKVSENEEELSNLKYCAILEEWDSNNYILSEPEANNDDNSRKETTQTSRAGVMTRWDLLEHKQLLDPAESRLNIFLPSDASVDSYFTHAIRKRERPRHTERYSNACTQVRISSILGVQGNHCPDRN